MSIVLTFFCGTQKTLQVKVWWLHEWKLLVCYISSLEELNYSLKIYPSFRSLFVKPIQYFFFICTFLKIKLKMACFHPCWVYAHITRFHWGLQNFHWKYIVSWCYGAVVALMDSVGLVTRICGFESRLQQEFSMTEVRPLSKAPNPQLLSGRRSTGCPLLQVCVHLDGLNALISLLVILCIIVYVTNKAHLSLIMWHANMQDFRVMMERAIFSQ